MLCGVKPAVESSKRRRALTCISNKQQTSAPSNKTGNGSSEKRKKRNGLISSLKYNRDGSLDKENTPLDTQLVSGVPGCDSEHISNQLPVALSKLRLAGVGDKTQLPLDNQTARKLINRHFSASDAWANAHASPLRRNQSARSQVRTQNDLVVNSVDTVVCGGGYNLQTLYNTTAQGRTGIQAQDLTENNKTSSERYLKNQGQSGMATNSQKSLLTNRSSIQTIIQHAQIDPYASKQPVSQCVQGLHTDSTHTHVRSSVKRSRTESNPDIDSERLRQYRSSTHSEGRHTVVEQGGHQERVATMCGEKRRAVAIASSLAEQFGIDSRGMLKISVSAKDDAIIIKISEALDLKNSWSDVCSAYVKAEVCPAISGQRSAQTSTVANSNSPSFLQTLTLPTSLDDLQKRLVISVWHLDAQKRCSEFLGCLSFGIRHLAYKTRQNKTIEGWYHILPESLGHRKHILAEPENVASLDAQCTQPEQSHELQCTSAEQMLAKNKSIDLDASQKDGKDLVQTNSRNLVYTTISISGHQGYGFTVHSYEPVTISRVRAGSIAEEEGLHAGDVITAVNQIPVQSKSARDVALMIRQSSENVTLDILCSHYTQSIHQYPGSCLNTEAQVHNVYPTSPHAVPTEYTGKSVGSIQSITSSQYAHIVRQESLKNCENLFSNLSTAQLIRKEDKLKGNSRVFKCASENNVLTPKIVSAKRRVKEQITPQTTQKIVRSQTYSVMHGNRITQKSVENNTTKWDPSMSDISVTSGHQLSLQSSFRNDSYHAAISALGSHTSLNKGVLYDPENKENSVPFVRPLTLKSYSTFSLATEAEVVSTGGANTPGRKRVVRRRMACKKRLTLTPNVNNTPKSHISHNTSLNESLPTYCNKKSHRSSSVTDRVSVVPLSVDSIQYSDSTMDSEDNEKHDVVQTPRNNASNIRYMNDSCYTDESSYGTRNAAFFKTHNSLQSCTLESDYYSDSPQYSHNASRLEGSSLTACEQRTPNVEATSGFKRHLADGGSATGSIDGLWLICSPKSQENLVSNLWECERRFLVATRLGLTKYLWPCRTILSAPCFRAIFSNIEKLVALSEYLEQQVSAELNGDQPAKLQIVLQLYTEKLPLLLESYQTYAQQYPTATQALDAAKLHSLALQQFVQTAVSREPAFSIDELLLFPLHHVDELVQELRAVQHSYPRHENLASMVEDLEKVLENIDLQPLENASSCAPSEAEES